MISKVKYGASFVFVRSDKVKKVRRSFPYDPDRTKKNEDKHAKKYTKNMNIKMQLIVLERIDLRLPIS